MKDNN